MFDHKIPRLTLLVCLLTTALTLPLSVLAEEIVPITAIDDDLALGQDVNRQKDFRPAAGTGTSDLFGSRGGNVHPFISLTGLYSDNIYNASSNEESDFLTILSPGVLLAYPGIKDMPGASFATSNLSPGGLLDSREAVDYFRRFQTSLLYQADLQYYADNSASDMNHHRVEGMLQFNLKGGVSLDLAGEYKLSADAPSGSTLLDEYQSDLIDMVLGIEIGSKMNLDLGYSGFQLDYDADRNNGRDRQDTSFTGRLSFEILAKTAIFAEYQLIDINYDRQVFPDNELTKSNVGIKWDVTAKSSGHFKLGLTSRDHEAADLADADELFYQLQALHQFTPKTSVQLTGTRRLTETTIAGTNYIVNNQTSLTYRQEMSRKIVANLDLSYGRDKFDQPVTYGTETKKQVDDTLLITPTLDYLMKDWFIVSLSYSLTERDSNFDILDYTSNAVLFRLTGYL